MAGASYIPGTWLGIVRSRTAVLLGPGLPAELAGAVWELLAGRPEPHEVLAAVTSSSGGSLTQLPSFGILDFSGPLRVFLRGDIDLTVEQPGGAVDLDGRDVTTWNERKFVVPGTCRLGIASSSAGNGHAGEYPELPLGEGVVLLQSLTLGVQAGPAAVAPAGADTAGADTAGADTAGADTARAGKSPASAGGLFAVDTAGEVDGPAASDNATSRASAAAGQPDADRTATGVNHARDAREEPEAAETGAAETRVAETGGAGTVVGVIEEGPCPEAERAGDLSGIRLEGIDPDATIAPGTIIDLDGELGVDAEGRHSEGPYRAGPGARVDGAGVDSEGADSAGVDSEGADSAGVDSEGADSAGLHFAGVGSDGRGTAAAGADAAEPGSAEADSAGLDSTGLDRATRNQAEAASGVEMTSSYDHLWDRTVIRNIEDAAVREEPDADSGHVLPQQKAALPAADSLPALGARAATHAGAGNSAASAPTRTNPHQANPDQPNPDQPNPDQPNPDQPNPDQPNPERPNPGQPAPAQPDPAQPDSAQADSFQSRPASPGLIDSVPWRTGGAAQESAPRPSPSVGTPPAPSTPAVPSVRALITPEQATPAQATRPQHTPPQAAPAQNTSGPAPSAPHPASGQGGYTPAGQAGNGNGPHPGFDPDHDGQTVMKSSLPGTPGSGPSGPATHGAATHGAATHGAATNGPATNGPAAGGAAAQQEAAGPLVLARVCAQGHPNPPTRAQCSACGSSLLPDAVQVARPRLGRMRLSTGELLDLDESMVIGRQPSVSRVQGGVMPRLVQVASPGGDISRSHVEVRLEGWHVMLCDLKATNGTVLVREGQPPRRLAQNEMAILLDGDIAELGDNISMRFEEIP